MIKLFAILIGLSFLICCLGLNWLLPTTFAIFRPPYHEEQLPQITKWCLALSPWLKYLGFAGLIYPVTVMAKKNTKVEEVLVYFSTILLIVTFLFFSFAFAAMFPWIVTTGAHSP